MRHIEMTGVDYGLFVLCTFIARVSRVCGGFDGVAHEHTPRLRQLIMARLLNGIGWCDLLFSTE